MTPPGITVSEDGKLRWAYELNMWRRPILLFGWLKGVCLAVLLTALLFGSITAVLQGLGTGAMLFLGFVGFGLPFTLIIFGISYVILGCLYRGRYGMVFTMAEAGVMRQQIPRHRKTAAKLGAAALLVGIAAKNPGIATGGAASSNTAFYSEFNKVRRLKADRRRGLIRVDNLLLRNQIFASPEQYDFVWEYIASRCENAVVKGDSNG